MQNMGRGNVAADARRTVPKREARSKGPSFLTFRVRPGKFVQGRATPIYFRGQPMLRVTALFEGHLDADGVGRNGDESEAVLRLAGDDETVGMRSRRHEPRSGRGAVPPARRGVFDMEVAARLF